MMKFVLWVKGKCGIPGKMYVLCIETHPGNVVKYNHEPEELLQGPDIAN